MPTGSGSNGKTERRRGGTALALQRNAREKLGRILDAAERLDTARFFRGRMDHAHLRGYCGQFDAAQRQIELGRKGGRTAVETAQELTDRAAATVAAVHGYVDIFYPHGTEGRSRFFASGPGQKTLPEQLQAAIDGVRWDRQQDHPLLPDGDKRLDLGKATDVLLRLKEASTHAETHADDADAAMTVRNRVGEVLREMAKAAEKLVRQIHHDQPEKLREYGLRPLLHQIARPPRPQSGALQLKGKKKVVEPV